MTYALLTHLLPATAGVTVTGIALSAEALHLTLRAPQPQAACPLCGTLSRRVHSCYQRSVGDLPWAGRAVQCTVAVRRFRCGDTACPRRIFTERLPALVAPSARRTVRLAGLLRVLGLVVGGRAGVRWARRLGAPLPLTSLLRLVRQEDTAPPLAPARAVGIDDFALRRGQR
jgi:zinc-finger of transposase IS204/IS1001/IS1096/IS1165